MKVSWVSSRTSGLAGVHLEAADSASEKPRPALPGRCVSARRDVWKRDLAGFVAERPGEHRGASRPAGVRPTCLDISTVPSSVVTLTTIASSDDELGLCRLVWACASTGSGAEDERRKRRTAICT